MPPPRLCPDALLGADSGEGEHAASEPRNYGALDSALKSRSEEDAAAGEQSSSLKTRPELTTPTLSRTSFARPPPPVWCVDHPTRLRQEPKELGDWVLVSPEGEEFMIRAYEPLERCGATEGDFSEVSTRHGYVGWIRTAYLQRWSLGDRMSRGVSCPERPQQQHHRAFFAQRAGQLGSPPSPASPMTAPHSDKTTRTNSTVRIRWGGVSAANTELTVPLPSMCWGLSGLVVMLADSDAGSLVMCAQTGRVWGYSFVALQFLLVIPLYMAQELTVRVGVGLGMGYAEAVRHLYGQKLGAVTVGLLGLISVGTLITEMAAIAGVGSLAGVPPEVSIGAMVVVLSTVVVTGSYRQVEAAALLFGAFEFTFFVTMILARPSFGALIEGTTEVPLSNPRYATLIAANVGAAMQPWMIFYQQSAIVDNHLGPAELPAARRHTLIGAIVTQAVAVSVMVTAAGTLWGGSYSATPPPGFRSVAEIADTLTPHLGTVGGSVLFGLGFGGSALVGAIVVSLTAAWGLGEAFGFARSLEHAPMEAPWFYGAFVSLLFAAYVLTVTSDNLVAINTLVQVMNAVLLPVVLFFLFQFARMLPPGLRLEGTQAVLYGVVFSLCSGLGLVCSFAVFF
eukprot:Hpha_TRINITY_DN34249_c0_g1::TRINITY_DN34249_c0_g1_i1::g.34348::m.34348